ncbi:MAG: hypothetical protein J3K34DRAFT_510027 [Monoraphidium minutum]|nr:MAG: hypothetical protein J3K34DRAFT_510027 [Monoraphidium minutum]
MGRDVDRLDPMPDGKLCEQDQAYLEKHGIGQLFNGIVLDIARQAPADPLQFMIDTLTLGPELAMQSAETGLPKHRQSKLEKVFRVIDKAGTGKLSLRALQAYANSHGGETLTNADLRAIFKDFKPGMDHLVGLPQFLTFFSRVSRTINNRDFDAMVDEMSVRILRSAASSRPIAAVAWSPCGAYLLAGEGGGAGSSAGAAVHVLDVATGACAQQLRGQHRHGVGSLCFSPDGRLLATTGAQYDGQVCLWDWRSGQLLARQALQGEAAAAVFTEDGSNLIGVGKGAYKVWALGESPGAAAGRRSSGAAGSGGVVLTAKPVTLKDHRGAAFVDVRAAPTPAGQPPGSSGVYALSSPGVLVLMRATGRMPDKAVDLKVRAAFGLSAAPGAVAAACAHGIVRMFAAKSLEFRGTLPRLLPRGAARGAGGAAVDPGSLREDAFPDAVGCTFSACGRRLAVAYADRAVVMWDVSTPAAAERLFALAAHSDSVWDLTMLPPPRLPAGAAAGGGAAPPPAPARAATCSADGSVRLWNLGADGPSASRTLAGIIITRADDGQPQSPAPAAAALSGSGRGGGGGPPPALLRCLRASPDGRHLAVGDESGNLRVYDLATLKLLRLLEAHNGVVLSLDFSPAADADGGGGSGGGGGGAALLASGGRDGLIHLYDARAGYGLVDTLDDHRAAVTGVRFAAGGRSLISCSADGSIVFRVLAGGHEGGCAVYRSEKLPRGCPLYDLSLDPLESKVAAVGQDGAVRFWDVASGQPLGVLAPERGAAEPVRVSIDPGGVVAVSSHADGSVRVHHLATGRLILKASGLGDMAAAAGVASDLERLVSVSGDGCVFVWRLPAALSAEIKAAAARVAAARARGAAPPSPAPAAAAAAQPPAAGGPPPAFAPAPAPLAASPERRLPALRVSPDRETQGSVGVSQTILRVQAGRPLVPCDRLPAWAAREVSPSPKKRARGRDKRPFEEDDDGDEAESAPAPRAAAARSGGGGRAAAAPGAGGKWAVSRKQGAGVFDGQRGVMLKVSGHRRLSAEASPHSVAASGGSATPFSSTAAPAGATPASGSGSEAWLSPATELSGASGARAGSASGSAAAACGAARRERSGQGGPRQQGRVEEAEEEREELVFEGGAAPGAAAQPAFAVSVVAPEAEPEADAEDDGGGSGDEGVPSSAAELYKQGSASRSPAPHAAAAADKAPEPPAPTPAPDTVVRDLFKRHFDGLAAPAAPPPPDERRQSLSARFFMERFGPGAAELVPPHQGAPPAAAAAVPRAGAARGAADPQRAAGGAAPSAGGAGAPGSPTRGQRPRQWREGKMDQELEGMRARLAKLQLAFATQQHARGSPAKPSPFRQRGAPHQPRSPRPQDARAPSPSPAPRSPAKTGAQSPPRQRRRRDHAQESQLSAGSASEALRSGGKAPPSAWQGAGAAAAPAAAQPAPAAGGQEAQDVPAPLASPAPAAALQRRSPVSVKSPWGGGRAAGRTPAASPAARTRRTPAASPAARQYDKPWLQRAAQATPGQDAAGGWAAAEVLDPGGAPPGSGAAPAETEAPAAAGPPAEAGAPAVAGPPAEAGGPAVAGPPAEAGAFPEAAAPEASEVAAEEVQLEFGEEPAVPPAWAQEQGAVAEWGAERQPAGQEEVAVCGSQAEEQQRQEEEQEEEEEEERVEEEEQWQEEGQWQEDEEEEEATWLPTLGASEGGSGAGTQSPREAAEAAAPPAEAPPAAASPWRAEAAAAASPPPAAMMPSSGAGGGPAAGPPKSSLKKGLMALLGIDNSPTPAKRRAPAAAATPAPPSAAGATPPQFAFGFGGARAGAARASAGGAPPPGSVPRMWPGWGGIEGTPPAATPVAGLIPFSFQARGGAAAAAPPAHAGADSATTPPGAGDSGSRFEPAGQGGPGGAGGGVCEGGFERPGAADHGLRQWNNPMFLQSPGGGAPETPAAAAAAPGAAEAAASPLPLGVAAGVGEEHRGTSSSSTAGAPVLERPPASGSPPPAGAPPAQPQLVTADSYTQTAVVGIGGGARAAPQAGPAPQPAAGGPGGVAGQQQQQREPGPASGSKGAPKSTPKSKKPRQREPPAEGSPGAGMLGLLQRMRLFAAGGAKSGSPKKRPPSGGAAAEASPAGAAAAPPPAAQEGAHAAPGQRPAAPAAGAGGSGGGRAPQPSGAAAAPAGGGAPPEDELEIAAQQLRAATDAVQRLLAAEAARQQAAAAAEPAGAGGSGGGGRGAVGAGDAHQHLMDQVATSVRALQALAGGGAQLGEENGSGNWGIAAGREGAPAAIQDLFAQFDSLINSKLGGGKAKSAGGGGDAGGAKAAALAAASGGVAAGERDAATTAGRGGGQWRGL